MDESSRSRTFPCADMRPFASTASMHERLVDVRTFPRGRRLPTIRLLARDVRFAPGEVPERPNGADSKSVVPSGGPGVRIPPSPPSFLNCSFCRQFPRAPGHASPPCTTDGIARDRQAGLRCSSLLRLHRPGDAGANRWSPGFAGLASVLLAELTIVVENCPGRYHTTPCETYKRPHEQAASFCADALNETRRTWDTSSAMSRSACCP